ncbi:MAG: TraR/DksA family transcriptional regulator [Actinomycetota bacterium]|nr:TraR/DksA family transcriptional regulator [Actinomycetota bacterium]
MDKNKIETFKEKLLKEERRLAEELETMHSENVNTRFNPEEYGGDGNYEDHIADAASNTFDRERDLSLEQNIQDLLAQVGDALRRIKDGTYGRCTNCDKLMAEARLRAIPYADLCIDCKEEEERHR